MPLLEPTVRAAPVNPADIRPSDPPSEEAQRESRRLRVGHTMVGMTNPLAGTPIPTPAVPVARPASNPPPTFSLDNEPVQIPTTGLPPSVVGMMVLTAMLVVAVAGFLLLK